MVQVVVARAAPHAGIAVNNMVVATFTPPQTIGTTIAHTACSWTDFTSVSASTSSEP
jgi:hypothetical protein